MLGLRKHCHKAEHSTALALELAVGQEIGTQQKQCKLALWGGSCTEFAVLVRCSRNSQPGPRKSFIFETLLSFGCGFCFLSLDVGSCINELPS